MEDPFSIEMSTKAGHLSQPTKITESATDKVSYYEL